MWNAYVCAQAEITDRKSKLVMHSYKQEVKNPVAELAFMGKASIISVSSWPCSCLTNSACHIASSYICPQSTSTRL